MSFENNYPEISNSELWKIFTEKAGDDSAFITAVEEICKHGADLSKSIICFFPTFTLHDTTHIDGVCRWMVRLLGDRKNDLTAEEAAVLLMTACCHDVGMSVSEGYENELKKQLKAHFSGTYMEKWGAHFKKYPEDELAFRDTNELTDQMLRRYIRDNHHNRIEKQLPTEWQDALSIKYITRDDIVRLCRSHGLSLPDGGFSSVDPYRIDYNLCAVLLRLSDLFDYDALRAPQSLFLLLGLDKPDTPERKKSRAEWKKNSAGFFGDVKNGKILYSATFYDPQTEHEVQSYIDWANAELSSCESFISRFAGRWQNFRPPYRVKTDYKRIGYEAGDFHLTMDQDKIIRLLTGENIYSDPGVFVRELLQNAIDAVLYRRKLDRRFGENDGQITICTWDDSEGYTWFRIEDNGTGMDEHIVKEYMLKVGRSYYTSEEYRAETRNAERDTVFKPTSRFGIGILSCFMSDPEETIVEVLTKRYSTDRKNPNKAIRLNITGLHGYYYLTKTDEDHPGQPMHCPPGMEGENDNYLRGTGTTICVRLSRYKLGGQFSFKDIVDKYVMFPEVRVRYIDSEYQFGFDYPTHNEFMDVIHRLNDNSKETKEHIHPLPDNLFEELKVAMPLWDWNESNRPEIIIKYYSLDILASSENTSGVALEVYMNYPSVCCRNESNNFYELYLNYYFVDKEFTFSFFSGVRSEKDNDNTFVYLEGNEYQSTINLASLLTHEEQMVYQYTIDKIYYKSTYENENMNNDAYTAYNGIMLNNNRLIICNGNIIGALILFRGKNYPQLNISRNSITYLPLDALFDLALVNYLLPIDKYLPFELPEYLTEKCNLFTEQNYFDALNSHQDMIPLFKFDGKTIPELVSIVSKGKVIRISSFSTSIDDFFNHIALASIKKHFKICYDFEDNHGKLFFISNELPVNTLEFPISLFYHPKEKCSVFCSIAGKKEVYYNVEHHFSRWLIQNRNILNNQFPDIYNTIVSVMLQTTDKFKLIDSLNAILKHLYRLSGNPFDVTSELYLKPDEIKEQEQEDEDNE